jgi:hypothetical protein
MIMESLSPEEWIAIASHRLSHRWHHVDVAQLDEVAAELYRDDALRRLEPTNAAEAWLSPLRSASPPPHA